MFNNEEKVKIFEQHRKKLFGIAYRMLGTNVEAEDIMQEAYIRWHKTNLEKIKNTEAWLVTVVTRLSIDRLRKAKNERENYIGPWLPEPLAVSSLPTPEEDAEFSSSLSLAFMVLLEKLSPTERAVFLLHDIFECAYSDVARIIDKTEAASRQIVSRARKRIRTEENRFEADERERENLIQKFAIASNTGDEQTLLSLFSDDVRMTSDGGGKITAARKIVYGSKRLVRLFTIVGLKYGDAFEYLLTSINGEMGLLMLHESKPFAATTFEFKDGKISALYRVMNPEKLEAFENFKENSFFYKNVTTTKADSS